MIKKINKYIISFFVILLVLFSANSVFAISDLKGRILLQVQDKGQAWYVNPDDGLRYYLGRPDDAFEIMRHLGLGVSNNDINKFLQYGVPQRLAGKILLQVQDKGQAYYVDALNLKLYYLGRPADAFAIMREKGLGITNLDLATIAIAQDEKSEKKYSFKYQNKEFYLDLDLSSSLYQKYVTQPKVLTYPANNPPANPRDAFYAMMLSTIPGDTTIDSIVEELKKTAQKYSWSDDETLEFVLSFIQYIPYDHDKLLDGKLVPYYPYETLYLDKGVCSDKTFLAVSLLRKLGYGVAVLDFPDINHSAVGIQCPKEYSLNNTGYCYAETTNYFPIGIIPQNINGEASTSMDDLDNLFNSSNLKNIEVLQTTKGKEYTKIIQLKQIINNLRVEQNNNLDRKQELNTLKVDLDQQEEIIKNMKGQMDSYLANNQIDQYNQLVPQYNDLVNKYNSDLKVYTEKVNLYNKLIKNFNQELRDLYQKNS